MRARIGFSFAWLFAQNNKFLPLKKRRPLFFAGHYNANHYLSICSCAAPCSGKCGTDLCICTCHKASKAFLSSAAWQHLSQWQSRIPPWSEHRTSAFSSVIWISPASRPAAIDSTKCEPGCGSSSLFTIDSTVCLILSVRAASADANKRRSEACWLMSS